MNKIIHFMFAVILFSACAGKGDNEQKSDATNQCLADKEYDYEALLTKADIAKHVNIDESSFKKEISATKGKYGSCTYTWESDRPEKDIISKVTGAVHKRPDKNKVTIKTLDFYTEDDLKTYKQDSAIELFDQSYKRISQTEYNELEANFEKELGDKPEDLARAKKMLDNRMKFKYKSIDNLGDRAYWQETDYGVELVVLTGKARFTIVSKTTGEPETSLKDAVNFAKEVLAKC